MCHLHSICGYDVVVVVDYSRVDSISTDVHFKRHEVLTIVCENISHQMTSLICLYISIRNNVSHNSFEFSLDREELSIKLDIIIFTLDSLRRSR